ncbi:hypothetical protein MKZ38_010429 [Zalerion maritima]|uniref:Folylpolyglutamate synthase n=1 Tax=Zalerion maritima TaxID=339359 RepID=A0AAD5RTN8_9PEZI|nr:hypothetical protein MKZ38_010429 [Zalerion maritima]
MASIPKARTYNDAIDTLNTFQTPYHIAEQQRKAGIRPNVEYVREMRAYLSRIGYSTDELTSLKILHVAGTKGKGSTCAFANSILSRCRSGGDGSSLLKVGLLTSPHLMTVRERMCINSIPISEELFAKYFFEVYDKLTSSPDATVAPKGSAPIYARFLTLMSYHVFLQEKCQVSIYETGIGGEYDATNVVDHPVACAITTLAIDHVFALGNTVDKIAWHKAGILKAGSPAFTIPQAPEAAAVLEERAREKKVELRVLDVDPRLEKVNIRPSALFQKRNATLGIALAEEGLKSVDSNFTPDPKSLPPAFVEGLENMVCRGRCEVKPEGDEMLWHLDGAHTVDSLRIAAKWFAGECKSRKGPRVLIFNQQDRKEAIDFLKELHACAQGGEGRSFDTVIFCTNVTFATGCKRDSVNHQHDPEAIKKLSLQHAFAEKWRCLDPAAKVEVRPTIEEALSYARDLQGSLEEGEMVQAFITGSLHLVGGALGILDGTDAV